MRTLADFSNILDLPHAIIIVGDRETGLVELLSFLSTRDGLSLGNPDLFIFAASALSVDHCRERIIPETHRRPQGRRKIICISASIFGTEAQAALLKALEERCEASIILLAERDDDLLATVRSRCVRLSAAGAGEQRAMAKIKAKIFLADTLTKRLQLSQTMTEKIDGDSDRAKEDRRKQKEFARVFVQELSVMASRSHKISAIGGDALLLGNRLLADPSPQLRLILEHLAFTLTGLETTAD